MWAECLRGEEGPLMHMALFIITLGDYLMLKLKFYTMLLNQS